MLLDKSCRRYCCEDCSTCSNWCSVDLACKSDSTIRSVYIKGTLVKEQDLIESVDKHGSRKGYAVYLDSVSTWTLISCDSFPNECLSSQRDIKVVGNRLDSGISEVVFYNG